MHEWAVALAARDVMAWLMAQEGQSKRPSKQAAGCTCAQKLVHSLAGSFLESEATKPRFSSLTDTFLTLKPTLSPGKASGRDSWCISTDLTSVVRAEGAKTMTMPGCMANFDQ